MADYIHTHPYRRRSHLLGERSRSTWMSRNRGNLARAVVRLRFFRTTKPPDRICTESLSRAWMCCRMANCLYQNRVVWETEVAFELETVLGPASSRGTPSAASPELRVRADIIGHARINM